MIGRRVSLERCQPPPGGGHAELTRVVVLSSEPASAARGADTQVPVVFPGYVLPDDSLEEPTHEGS